MLLQFSVENFKSIKDRAVLSMEASSDKEHRNNLVEIGKERILKAASVFGANAAGKSNLFLALTAAIVTVRWSDKRQIGEPLFCIVPFMFDEESRNKPTAFEFVFVAEGKKYVYGYSATIKKIYTEYLYVYNSQRPTVIFERDENEKEVYRFTNAGIKAKLKPLIERNTENKLFLATATTWNCEETRIPMLWLSNQINTYDTQYENLLNLTGDMYESDDDSSLRRFTNNILKEADINITDYIFESKDIPLGQLSPLTAVSKGIGITREIKGKAYKIETLHNVKQEDGKILSFSLELKNESKGTQNIFFMSPLIKRAFETGETLCIDEFDTSLHPMLVTYLVGLFNNPEVNKAGAQLIISTHTMTLLNLKELRRDQIYFVEKNRDTGASELYSLDEFSPRTREDVRKAYLLGRYGSVPSVGEGESLWG